MALHVLDERWAADGARLGTLVRYADDLVVFCRSRESAVAARELIEATVTKLGLSLNPKKTRIARLTRDAEGFDFLGFTHRMHESAKWRGRWYLQKWPCPRVMGSIRARTTDSHAHGSLNSVVAELNPVLRDWGAYLGYGNSSRKFSTVDHYVNPRLAILASRKQGSEAGIGSLGLISPMGLQLRVHRLSGTVRLLE